MKLPHICQWSCQVQYYLHFPLFNTCHRTLDYHNNQSIIELSQSIICQINIISLSMTVSGLSLLQCQGIFFQLIGILLKFYISSINLHIYIWCNKKKYIKNPKQQQYIVPYRKCVISTLNKSLKVMVFNATISKLYFGGQIYWWRKL